MNALKAWASCLGLAAPLLLAGCSSADMSSAREAYNGTGGSSALPGYSASAGSSAVATGVGGPASDVPANSGDNYQPTGTNPFVITAHDPLSTFGADVDTASYDIFRRDIGYSMLPQPDSVRLEE